MSLGGRGGSHRTPSCGCISCLLEVRLTVCFFLTAPETTLNSETETETSTHSVCDSDVTQDNKTVNAATWSVHNSIYKIWWRAKHRNPYFIENSTKTTYEMLKPRFFKIVFGKCCHFEFDGSNTFKKKSWDKRLKKLWNAKKKTPSGISHNSFGKRSCSCKKISVTETVSYEGMKEKHKLWIYGDTLNEVMFPFL